MLSSLLSAVILLLGITEATAAPQASGTLLPLPQICSTATYSPFRLVAIRDDTGDSYAVRLAPNDPTATSATSYVSTAFIDTNSTCTDCGVVPDYWSLKDMDLIPVSSKVPRGYSTINQDVQAGTPLTFITSQTTQPSYPEYCAIPAGTTPMGHVHYILAAHGSTSKFAICAWTSIYPPATKFTLYYQAPNIRPVGESCYPVTLSLLTVD